MLQASPVRLQSMCVCVSCCKDFRPGAYVSLMFMQLMLHKFATAGTRDRVERESGTGGESVALLPFVFFRCHGRHFVRFTLTSAALVPFVYCQFSLLHFWSPSKICHSPPRNVVVRSYIDGILYFPNGGGAGKERQGGGGEVRALLPDENIFTTSFSQRFATFAESASNNNKSNSNNSNKRRNGSSANQRKMSAAGSEAERERGTK